MTAASLELIGLHKSFGSFVAVEEVSLTVPRGRICGLLGPNGAGKTTTIRMIMDIIAPDRGRVLLDGRPRRREDLERIGYLPEERGLYRRMTVADHLAFLGELHGLKRKDAVERGARWLERLGLADRAPRKVEELSKGMQQKVQIAGTLLHEPEVVILDEPFSGLDPINQMLFKDLLAEYKQEGRTILFSTHVMEQAEKLCDHIALVSRGRLVLEGELAEIKRREGGSAYRLVAGGDLARAEAVAGVEQVVVDRQASGRARLFLRPGAAPAAVLRELVGFLEVHDFTSEEPALEEIFVKAVRDAA
ncbi:MAG TPA: ATP-binding cassette domain-containing protein [Thermoanaerobaculia bacterium]|nr:ATP-binding cassette domain-containing protein [Thermoanaerobaculia bacterium]